MAFTTALFGASAYAQVVKPTGFGTPAQAAMPLRLLNEAQQANPAPQEEMQKLAIVDSPMSEPVQQPSIAGTPPLGFPFTYPTKTSLADLVDQVSPAVVNIIVKTETAESITEGQGSGFIIDPNGELVTN